MPFVSVGELLAPISVEQPSGANLEYDGDFQKLDRDAQGKPEQQMGSTVVAAEEPDWKIVVKDGQALLARTKDLRVAVHLCKGLLRTGGLQGFSEGLFVLRGLLEGYWDTVHPRLDPDDDNDPTMRMNALAALCDSPTLAALRTTPLVNSRALGRYSLRDLAVASGELPPSSNKDEQAPTMAAIQGAFDSIEVDVLTATTTAAKSARDDVATIETLVTEKVGGSQAVNLSKLSALLAEGHKHLSAALARRQGGSGDVAGNGAGGGVAAIGQRSTGGPLGAINTRDDVIRALDLICAYYERNEPNSPVPILMKRSKRFVTMSFLEIMKDVAPDGVSQAELLKGHLAEEEGSSS